MTTDCLLTTIYQLAASADVYSVLRTRQRAGGAALARARAGRHGERSALLENR